MQGLLPQGSLDNTIAFLPSAPSVYKDRVGDPRQLFLQPHPAPAPFPLWVYLSSCFLFRSGVQKNNKPRCGSRRKQSWQAGSCPLSHRPAGHCLPLPTGSREENIPVLVLWSSKARKQWFQERPGQFRTQQGEGTA